MLYLFVQASLLIVAKPFYACFCTSCLPTKIWRAGHNTICIIQWWMVQIFILEWCRVLNERWCSATLKVGLNCRTVRRRPPRRGSWRANYGFESWRMRGVSGPWTKQTTPYCYHKQSASVLGFYGIGNAPMRPQQNSRQREEYQAQLARLESESR